MASFHLKSQLRREATGYESHHLLGAVRESVTEPRCQGVTQRNSTQGEGYPSRSKGHMRVPGWAGAWHEGGSKTLRAGQGQASQALLW